MLPSEALQRATTFDLQVLHISSMWRQYKEEVGDDPIKKLHYKAKNHKYSEDDLVAMLKKAKEVDISAIKKRHNNTRSE